MGIKIEIPEEKIPGFTEAAIKELNSQSVDHAFYLIDEAYLIERPRRGKDDPPEITQKDIKEASKRSMNTFPKKRWWQILIQATTPIFTLLIGKFMDTSNALVLYSCIVLLVILTGLLVYSLFQQHE